MKKLMLLFALVYLPAFAQNYTAVTASNIQNASGTNLAAGQICFLGTDAKDRAVPFQAGGGGIVITRPVCASVTAGAIEGGFQVANPGATAPVGIVYHVTIKDTNTKQIVVDLKGVSFSGGSFDFDAYQPNVSPVSPPSGGDIDGPFTINGDLTITGSCTGCSGLTDVGTPGTYTKVTTDSKGRVTSGAAAACADLSDDAASCSTDTTNASNISSGTLNDARLSANVSLLGSTISGSELGNPGVGTKGGVESKTCSGTDKLSAIGTDGIPVCSADQTSAGGEDSITVAGSAATNANFSNTNPAAESGYILGKFQLDTAPAPDDISLEVPIATSSLQGVVELATAAETTTGTDATRAVTPDGLAGSDFGKRVAQLVVFDFTTDTATGDGKYYFVVPAEFNGMNLVGVSGQVITAGTTGTTDVQLARCATAASGNACSGTVVDMLSTKLTIDSGENSSATAASAAVINGSNDDVATGQIIRVDVDAVSTTAAKGLIVTLVFQLP